MPTEEEKPFHPSHKMFYRMDVGQACMNCYRCECHDLSKLGDPCPKTEKTFLEQVDFFKNDPPVIIAPKAFKDVVNKTVPLVHYDKDGNRTVIGKATVNADKDGLFVRGSIDNDDYSKAFLGDNYYSFSVDGGDTSCLSVSNVPFSAAGTSEPDASTETKSGTPQELGEPPV